MPQENPLEELVLSILNENGFDKLDEEAKKEYLPQFLAQAQQRIGAALLPLLSEDSAKQFVELSKKETNPEKWWEFWQTNVPNFNDVVKNALAGFAQEVKNSFSI
ncbi:MAG: hypothetical protein A2537_02330 [Candidatus Magasanikbacteria bacterium RIFOXYD2_FULL_36_9]|uniref:Uncharacterized protein n=1 Tax=Candidatus Magasanikbacteria bacterium RIFOXYD2_FULL_36_9 TaxID=1798707 RepID=A0A1F6P0L7_9BACT|nr:MAG: hypothetical protein A2537_02330 [Candidatus Magasanikbacteria bacterium RIFOXYD2_FULL_36_9]